MFTLFCITAFIWRPFHFSEASLPPTQSTDHYKLRYAITENQPEDLHIGKLDDDLQQNPDMQSTELIQLLQSTQRSGLRFELRDPSAYFRLHAITSVLSTTKSIDLEALCPRHCPAGSPRAQLHFVVNVRSDHNVLATILVEVAVIDVDDNEPRFPPTVTRPYMLQLKEVLYRPGMQIQLPEAVDHDIQPDNAKIAYRLESHPDDMSNALDTFQLLARNDSRLMLVLQRDLDYESTSVYRFLLVAWSPRNGDHNNWRAHHPSRKRTFEDRLEIQVNVLNINDIEPVFSKSVFEITVAEDLKVGSVIFTLSATDDDVDSTITYSMEQGLDSKLAEQFKVEPDGRVLLQRKFNYESRRDFSLPVRASDGEFFALARLEITVTDVNDELPEMVTVPVTVIVEENKPVRTLVGQLYIIDRDGVTVNGQVECREPEHLAGEQPLLFVPNEDTSTRTWSRVPGPVDKREQNYPAGFGLPLPELGMLEGTVYKSYSLYTRVTFDREAAVGQESYYSQLICWDGVQEQPGDVGYRSLTSTLTVSLGVADANDNRPVFEQQYYEAEVKENSPVGTQVLQVHARDADSKPEHKPHYQILSNELMTASFSVDSKSGWIVTNRDIDRETQALYQTHYCFEVTVRDKPSVDALSTTDTFCVRVLDVNDNKPVFTKIRGSLQEEYAEFNLTSLVDVATNITGNSTKSGSPHSPQTLHLPEDTVYISWYEQPGYCALIAEASDADEGRNAQLVFSVRFVQPKTRPTRQLPLEGSKESIEEAFQIEPLTGRLILTRSLQAASLGPHELVLTVRDSGDPKLSEEKNIKLVVTDQPPKGDWLVPKPDRVIDANGLTRSDTSVTNTVLTGIILSGFSTLLATALITAILCMVRPCRKATSRPGGGGRSRGKHMKEDSIPGTAQPMACIPADACGCCDSYSFQRPLLTDGYMSPFNTKLITPGVLLPNATGLQLPGVEHRLFLSEDPMASGLPGAGGVQEHSAGQRESQRDSCVFIASPQVTNFGTFSSAAVSSDHFTENSSTTDSTWLANTKVWSPPPASYIACNSTCSGVGYQLSTGSRAPPLPSPKVTTVFSSASHHLEASNQPQQQHQKPRQQFIPFGDSTAGHPINSTGRFNVSNQGVAMLRQDFRLHENGGSLDRQRIFTETGQAVPEAPGAIAPISGAAGADIGIVAVVGGLVEEQRSDSGRGGSDEEASNHHFNPVVPKPLLVSAHIGSSNGSRAFRSATVRTYCPDPGSGYVLSGLVYPSLPRVLQYSDEKTSTFEPMGMQAAAETMERLKL